MAPSCRNKDNRYAGLETVSADGPPQCKWSRDFDIKTKNFQRHVDGRPSAMTVEP